MELFIARHAKSICNEKEVNASCYEEYCGGLSEEGKKQAKELIAELSKQKYDKVITSPLKRAIQTLEPYLETLEEKPKVIISKLITERDLGELSGTKRGKVGEYQKEHNVTDKVSWIPPKGESLIDVYKRAEKFIKWLKENCSTNDKILLSSHSVFITTLLIAIDKGDIKKFYELDRPENGSLIYRKI